MIKGFEPILAKEAKVLILGSMPSVTSLEKQEYYGFKYNRFWKIMSAYFNLPLNTYEEKTKCILNHKIILWDVIASCEREGSLDSAIHHEVVNDIEGILKQNPSVEYVICNGKKSYSLYKKYFSHLSQSVVSLPSTSNANRTISEEKLIQMWFTHLDYVFKQ